MTTPPLRASGKKGEQAALSRELAGFLIEFSIALNKHAMYPGSHPALGPAAEGVVHRLDTLFQHRRTLSLGVARNQLVIEGVATDPSNPVLSDLAARLHRHHLGAVTFRPGVDATELQEVLSLVAVEAERTGQPLGLGDDERLSAWPHIRLYSLTYERLELIEEDERAEREEEDTRRRTHAAQLWIGLARAALAVGDDDEDLPDADAAVVAHAINQHSGGTAYDQVIVGYLLQIAEEVGRGTSETHDLRKRTSNLVSSLEKDTLQRLLDMGGDRAQRREFLLNASEGLAVDAVLDLLRSASEMQSGEAISHYLLRMLSKLARHSEVGSASRRARADRSVRDQVGELINNWSLPDPNPTGYQQALDQMASSDPIFAVSPEAQYRPEPQRMLEMAVEVNVMGDQVAQAVRSLAEEGSFKWLFHMLEIATTTAPDVASAVRTLLETPEMVGWVAMREPIDRETLEHLVSKVGAAAAEPLFVALEASESLPSRRLLIDRLVSLGPKVGPLAVQRLVDERWFIKRNMLTIISELPDLPPGFNPAEYAQHSEPRVRQEAIRLLFRDPNQRERAICVAVADTDERTVLLGLNTALEGCPDAALPLVVSRATTGETEEVRTLGIRVLGASRHRSALETLLGFVAPQRRWLRWKPPHKSAEYLAALSAVRQFSEDPRVQRALSAASKSHDPEISRRAMGGTEEA